MKTITTIVIMLLLVSCSRVKESIQSNKLDSNFIIAFGSCNDQNRENNLWKEVLKNKPNVWIWGGDNIYADTENMQQMESDYLKLKNSIGYKKIRDSLEILGTWDDHDYGINDGGAEFIKKDSAQQLFLDFFDVDPNDSRRKREGIYNSKIFTIDNKSIKIITLDTRYFRTELTEDTTGVKRYIPNKPNDGTILGGVQWKWLENELLNSKSDFNIIVSSIQFLSQENGWETWGNVPHEIQKMGDLIVKSKAKGVIFLSGDRHISEISMLNLRDLDYPLYDFTSSGLTHTYEEFKSEPNKHRISNVINKKNFGVLKLNLSSNLVTMEIRGIDNSLLQSITQQY